MSDFERPNYASIVKSRMSHHQITSKIEILQLAVYNLPKKKKQFMYLI